MRLLLPLNINYLKYKKTLCKFFASELKVKTN
jgi:hypothetical protein